MDEVSELHSDNPAGDDCRPLAGAGLASGFMLYLKVRNRNKIFFRNLRKKFRTGEMCLNLLQY